MRGSWHKAGSYQAGCLIGTKSEAYCIHVLEPQSLFSLFLVVYLMLDWGLKSHCSRVLQESVQGQLKKEATEYLDLPLAPSALVLVQTDSECTDAAAHLRGHKALGVDAEWQPCLTKTERPMPSILQVLHHWQCLCTEGIWPNELDTADTDYFEAARACMHMCTCTGPGLRAYLIVCIEKASFCVTTIQAASAAACMVALQLIKRCMHST